MTLVASSRLDIAEAKINAQNCRIQELEETVQKLQATVDELKQASVVDVDDTQGIVSRLRSMETRTQELEESRTLLEMLCEHLDFTYIIQSIREE